VVRLRDYTGSHLGPMLHRERLLSVTKPSGERTSENSVKAKFTGIAHLPHRPGPEGLPQEGA
jgi:hypothetical protein